MSACNHINLTQNLTRKIKIILKNFTQPIPNDTFMLPKTPIYHAKTKEKAPFRGDFIQLELPVGLEPMGSNPHATKNHRIRPKLGQKHTIYGDLCHITNR